MVARPPRGPDALAVIHVLRRKFISRKLTVRIIGNTGTSVDIADGKWVARPPLHRLQSMVATSAGMESLAHSMKKVLAALLLKTVGKS